MRNSYTLNMNHIVLIALSLLVFSAPVYAQSTDDFTLGNSVDLKDDGAGTEPKELTEEDEATFIEDKYATSHLAATVENLSKLYVKKGAVPIKRDDALDNYLMINECDIYEKFIDDDFEWQRVRDTAREMLNENKENFSDSFKVTVPIDLGRYDLERKGFPLINKTAFRDMRRVEIGGNSAYSKVCGKEGDIDYFPRNVIMIISKPFNYSFVEVDEHIAQAFIVRRKYEEVDRPKELGTRKYNRIAFARMRIKFKDYQGQTKAANNSNLAIMFGRLEGVDIFEDLQETRLLSTIDY